MFRRKYSSSYYDRCVEFLLKHSSIQMLSNRTAAFIYPKGNAFFLGTPLRSLFVCHAFLRDWHRMSRVRIPVFESIFVIRPRSSTAILTNQSVGHKAILFCWRKRHWEFIQFIYMRVIGLLFNNETELSLRSDILTFSIPFKHWAIARESCFQDPS